MKRVWAIAKLTFAEGIRMRIVLVALMVLVILLLRMPFALRGDETLAGRLQNFIAYAFAAVSVLLTTAMVFFSCATLSHELKERSLQLVVTKPVSRFQILVGKWLGVNLLATLILALSGVAVYGMAYYIKTRPVQFERDRLKVEDVVWASRISSRPTVPLDDLKRAAEANVDERIKTGQLDAQLRQAALDEKLAELQKNWMDIPNGYANYYLFENLRPPEHEDSVIQVQFKVLGVPMPLDELLTIQWMFCDPDSWAWLMNMPRTTQEKLTERHEFLVRAAPVIKDGRALLQVMNPYDPTRETKLVFQSPDDLKILYKVDAFELNFLRALVIIELRILLITAVGIFFSVFVSFPVAVLCAATFYLICLGQPFWLEGIGANLEFVSAKNDPFGQFGPAMRAVLVPLIKAVFPNFVRFDGAIGLVNGEYIPAGLVLQCFLHTAVYGGILLLLPGWLIFANREVAEVQV